jgi:protein TonB
MSAQTKTPETVSNRPVITPADRLGLTLCLAIITHAVVVLGITFSQEQKPPPRYDAMEIILVQQRSEAPDEAKILAQASLDGGGDTDEEVSPATPIPSPFPDTVAEITTPPPADLPAVLPEADASRELLAVNTVQDEIVTTDNALKIDPAEVEEAAETPRPDRQLPTASTLLTNSMKIASLSAEIQRKLEAQAERPKRKFISASTREFKYAAYMEAWRAKVERIGNLNYPDAARQQGLSGSLILDVALSQDGSIKEIIVRRSSGNKILDDAAIRIVNLAAPYSPFPEDFKDEVDILHITRTWQFLNNTGFR